MMCDILVQDYALETPAVMISLLGSFRLQLGDDLASVHSGSKCESLLIQLTMARRRRMPRGDLLRRLWPDRDLNLAGQSLNSLVYQLNKLVTKPSASSLVHHENGYYYLNRSEDVGVDVDYFDAWRTQGMDSIRHADEEWGLVACERALALYRGDLCGDSSIRTLIERERLRGAFLGLLAFLADFSYTRGDLTQALAYTHRLLRHDACREDAHRMAMRCYVKLGTRAQAFRQYQLCCHILNAEFEAQPEPATKELLQRIRLDPTSI